MMFNERRAEYLSLPLRYRLRYGLASGACYGIASASSNLFLREFNFFFIIITIVVLQIGVYAVHRASIKNTSRATWFGKSLWTFSLFGFLLFGVYTANTFFECSLLDVTRRFAGCEQVISYKNGPVFVDYAPNGSTVVLTGGDGIVQRWTPGTRAISTIISEPGPESLRERHLTTISWLSKHIAIVRGSMIELWNIESGEQLQVIELNVPKITSIHYLKDGVSLLITSGDNQVIIYDTKQDIIRHVIKTRSPVDKAAVSRNSEVIALFGETTDLEIYNYKGDLIANLPHQSDVVSAAVNADGNLIISGDWKGNVYKWSADDFSSPLIFQVFELDQATNIQFSPDDKLVVIINDFDDRRTAIRFWDVSSGKLVAELPQRFAWSTTFSPDGTLLVASGLEEIFVWKVPNQGAG